MLRLWMLVCACVLAGCTSGQRNAPGTADPGVGSPGADEVGQAAAQTVGSAGGSVGTPSQSAFAAVPPGALSDDVNLSVRVQSPQGMPLQGNLLTNVYDFGPDGTAFAKPVVLTVAVSTPPASNQQAMLAYLDANQTWQALLDSGYNPSTGLVTATTAHFTSFTVVAFGTDGGGCVVQYDPNAFCGRSKLICNPYDNACGPPEYTIGGSATGLHGSVSLADNLGDVVVLASNGSFAFPGDYGVGESYVINVADQPQNQHCQLSGAQGTVTNADVVSIMVTCVDLAPATYPIGGHVSGLDANESVTLVQDSQSVTVASNGDFVFPEELTLQGVYAINVSSAPAGKSCEVTQNASGTVTGVIFDIQVVCSVLPPTITQVGGSVRGLLPKAMVVLENLTDPNDAVAVAGNGNFIVSTSIPVGENFNIVITLQPPSQVCRVAGGAGVATVDMYWGVQVSCATPGQLQFATGQNATVVLGEPDFVSSNTAGTVAANLMSAPGGATYVAPDGALYVGDTGSYRGLVYNRVPASNGAHADGVLGQASATQSVSLTPASAAAGTGHFTGMGGQGNTLLVADPFDHRVLVFLNRLPAGDSNASWVLGQDRLSHSANLPSCGSTGLNAPYGVAMAAGKVLVADTANHRVLIYNAAPNTSGVPANLALGQPDFNTCTLASAVGATTLNAPQGVWSDGNRLLVADTGANRVLVWLTFPTAMQQAADAIIGQAGFDAAGVVTGSAGTLQPTGVASDGNSIWTSSAGFHRVEQWAFPTAPGSGPAATAVLGQIDFNGMSPNACNCSIPSVFGLNAPAGVSVAGTQLLVTDTGNNRILIFASE